jgi:DnaJ-class molecular chaperone
MIRITAKDCPECKGKRTSLSGCGMVQTCPTCSGQGIIVSNLEEEKKETPPSTTPVTKNKNKRHAG